MITNIRRPQTGDVHYLLDIDLKCFEDSLSLDEWREMLKDQEWNVLVGTVQSAPVGLIMWQDTILHRIAVKPAFRHLQVGSKLLRAVENILIQRGNTQLTIFVPESLCQPSHSIDASSWLISRNFRAVGIKQNGAQFCGKTEDAIRFSKTLLETITHD